MWTQRPSFRFEIDNFSEKEDALVSEMFVSGGCEWYIYVNPKGDSLDDHMSLFLYVANSESLRTGWKRRAKYYFSVLNQSEKELYRSPVGDGNKLFCAESISWGFKKNMPLSKLGEIGGLEKDKLIIDVYINVVEAFDGEGGDVSKQEETMNSNDFHVFASHTAALMKIFVEQPELANDFKPMNQVAKNNYLDAFHNLSNTLQKHPDSLSGTELDKACKEMSELIYIQLDWLKSNLDELSLEGKKPSNPDGSLVQECVKNLELMQSSTKTDPLKSNVEDVSLARKKAKANVQKLEEFVKNIGVMEPQLDDVLLERKKISSYDAYGSHEERIKNLEQTVLNLKVELEKKKAVASDDDEYFLVNKAD